MGEKSGGFGPGQYGCLPWPQSDTRDERCSSHHKQPLVFGPPASNLHLRCNRSQSRRGAWRKQDNSVILLVVCAFRPGRSAHPYAHFGTPISSRWRDSLGSGMAHRAALLEGVQRFSACGNQKCGQNRGFIVSILGRCNRSRVRRVALRVARLDCSAPGGPTGACVCGYMK